jgi:hypothetical protein
MARRVFLHVGLMKSATGYIQDLCDANRERLLSQGMFWTSADDNFLATDDLLGTWRERPGLAGAWDTLTAQLAAHPGDALVSNELLAPVNQRKRTRLVRALGPADVSVVITARDLARVIPSQWQTGARNRSAVAWHDYVSALVSDDDSEVAAGFWRRQDLPAIVASWAQQVALEQITVVTVPPAGAASSVVGERFARAIGVRIDGFDQPPPSNPSLGLVSAELLRQVNERSSELAWIEYRSAFRQALARLVLADRAASEPPIALDAGALDWARARGERLADAVAASGVRVVGELSDLVPSASVAPSQGAAVPTESELLDAAVDGIVGLGALLAKTRLEHDALVRAVEQWVRPEVTDADRKAFAAYEESLPDPPSEQLAASRFLRWRLAR